MKRVILAASLVALTAVPALARDHGDRGDHERARQAVTSGQVLPLRTVLTAVATVSVLTAAAAYWSV